MCIDFQSFTGRVELSTGRVHRLHGSWHEACSIVLLWFSTGRAHLLHGACNFTLLRYETLISLLFSEFGYDWYELEFK